MSDSGASEHQQLRICVVHVRVERRGKETVGVLHAGNVRVIEGVRIPCFKKSPYSAKVSRPVRSHRM